ncbi:MAG: DUF6531 domain-containing protein, partial [Pseudomonadota bacterium]
MLLCLVAVAGPGSDAVAEVYIGITKTASGGSIEYFLPTDPIDLPGPIWGSAEKPMYGSFKTSPGEERGWAAQKGIVKVLPGSIPSISTDGMAEYFLPVATLDTAGTGADPAVYYQRGREAGQTVPTDIPVPSGLHPTSQGIPDGVPRLRQGQNNLARSERAGADPVDLATGEFVHRHLDLSFPGFGIPFELRRSYRSRVNYHGVLGFGWDHSLNQRLVDSEFPGCEGEKLYLDGEGVVLRFEQAQIVESPADSVPAVEILYKSPPGLHLVLRAAGSRTTDGDLNVEWVLSEPEGRVRKFDARGLLGRIEDPNGNGLSVVWEPSSFPDGWRVLSVTDSVGRTIRFSYTDAGYLQRVFEETSGLEAIYVQDENGDLVSAMDSFRRTESYLYDNDSLRTESDYVSEGLLRQTCADSCSLSGTSCHSQGLCDAAGRGYAECTASCDKTIAACESECDDRCISGCERELGKPYRNCSALCARDCASLVSQEDICQQLWDRGDPTPRTICEGCESACLEESGRKCSTIVSCIATAGAVTGVYWLATSVSPWTAAAGTATLAAVYASSLVICIEAKLSEEENATIPRFFEDLWELIKLVPALASDVASCLSFWDGCNDFSDTKAGLREVCNEPFFLCCRDGDRCDPASCQAGFGCFDTCRREFLGEPQPEGYTCSTSFSVSDGCRPVAQERCKEECTPLCVEECMPRCGGICTNQCKAAREPCRELCTSIEFTEECNRGCVDSCVEAGRAGGPPRYGQPTDLNHNLLEISNGAGVKYLINSYGIDATKPSFDAVETQYINGEKVSIEYRDLFGESRGVVVAPIEGAAAQYIESREVFQTVDICRSPCLASTSVPQDSVFVPWRNELIILGQEGAGTVGFQASATGAGVDMPPSVLKISGSSESGASAASVTGPDGLPFLLEFTIGNIGGTAIFKPVGPGLFSVAGDAAAVDHLVSVGEITILVDRNLVFRAYAGHPTSLVHLGSGSCIKPFVGAVNEFGQIQLTPTNACSGEIVVSPMATELTDPGLVADSQAGARALASTDAFAGSLLAPRRIAFQWREVGGIRGRYEPIIGPNSGAAPDSLAEAEFESVASAPLFRQSIGEIAIDRPAYAFHLPESLRPSVVVDSIILDLPTFDVPDIFRADIYIPECLFQTPIEPARGSGEDAPGPKPDWAAVIVDSFGTPSAHYFDDGAQIRSINIGTWAVRSYNYDSAGRLIAIEEPEGGRTCIGYGPFGEIKKVLQLPQPYGDGATGPLKWIYDHQFDPVRPTKLRDPRDPTRALVEYAWDERGNLLSVTNGVGEATRFLPNQWGLPASVTGPDGTTTSYTYDQTVGVLERVVVGSEPSLTTVVDTDAAGHPLSFTTPLGEHHTLGWDGDRLLAHTVAGGDGSMTVSWAYNDAGLPETITDGKQRLAIEYDALGYERKVVRSDIDGQLPASTSCFLRGPDGRARETVLPEGQRLSSAYDGEGRPIATVASAFSQLPGDWDDGCPAEVVLPDGAEDTWTVSSTTYSDDGRPRTLVDGRGLQTSLRYDAYGRLATVTNPEGTSQRSGYDALGNLTWKAAYGAAGQTVPYRRPQLGDPGLEAAAEYEYDAAGRLVKEDQWHFVAATGQPVGDGHVTTTYAYGTGGRTVTVTDDLGQVTTLELDGAGRRTAVVLPTGDRITTRYLDGGQTILTSQPAPTPSGVLSQVVRLTAWGAPDTLETEDGLVLRDWEYDSHQRARSIVDASGMLAEFEPDAFGWVAVQRMVFAEGVEETVRRVWDRNGWLTAIASDAGVGTGERSFVYDYDLLGRVERVVDPLSNEETYSYEGATGLVATRIDARGVEYRNSWSPVGQLCQTMAFPPVDANLGEIQFRRFSYDALGRVVSALDSGESYPYATDDINTYLGWDSLGNKTGEWDTNLGVNYAI